MSIETDDILLAVRNGKAVHKLNEAEIRRLQTAGYIKMGGSDINYRLTLTTDGVAETERAEVRSQERLRKYVEAAQRAKEDAAIQAILACAALRAFEVHPDEKDRHEALFLLRLEARKRAEEALDALVEK